MTRFVGRPRGKIYEKVPCVCRLGKRKTNWSTLSVPFSRQLSLSLNRYHPLEALPEPTKELHPSRHYRFRTRRSESFLHAHPQLPLSEQENVRRPVVPCPCSFSNCFTSDSHPGSEYISRFGQSGQAEWKHRSGRRWEIQYTKQHSCYKTYGIGGFHYEVHNHDD